MSKPIIFISGPMRGYPDWNRAAFNEAAEQARNFGFEPLNPAILPITLPDKAYIPICLAMLNICDYLYALPGSDKSTGAAAEQAFARAQGIPILASKKELEHIGLWWDE